MCCGFCFQPNHNVKNCKTVEATEILRKTAILFEFLLELYEDFGQKPPEFMFVQLFSTIPLNVLKLLSNRIGFSYYSRFKTGNELTKYILRTGFEILRTLNSIPPNTEIILNEGIRANLHITMNNYIYSFCNIINMYYSSRNPLMPKLLLDSTLMNNVTDNIQFILQPVCSPPQQENGEPDREPECSICYSAFPETEFIKTGCKHEFCYECVCGVIKSNMSKKTLPCPMCRTPVNHLYFQHPDKHKELLLLNELIAKKITKKKYIVAQNDFNTVRLFHVTV